jgi:hypothetical protein
VQLGRLHKSWPCGCYADGDTLTLLIDKRQIKVRLAELKRKMTLDDLTEFAAVMHEEAQAKLEANFSEFCAALITTADEGFSQAQADLAR